MADSVPNLMTASVSNQKIKYSEMSEEQQKDHRHTQFKRIYDGIIQKRQMYMMESDGIMKLNTKGKGYVKNPRNRIHNLMFTKDFLEKGDIVTDGNEVQSIPEDLIKKGVSAEVIIQYHHSKHESDALWKLASDYSRERSNEIRAANKTTQQKQEKQIRYVIADQLTLAGKLLRTHHGK